MMIHLLLVCIFGWLGGFTIEFVIHMKPEINIPFKELECGGKSYAQ